MAEATPQRSELARQWAAALDRLEVRHPNGSSRVVIRVDDAPPRLYVGLDQVACTMTGEIKAPFAISTVALTYWPGALLARQWVAAAWAGYCQHEALELVTMAGDRAAKVLDPHAEPYVTNPINRGVRDGFPPALTPQTLLTTLALVMPIDDAARLMEQP